MGRVPTFCFEQMYRQNQILIDLLQPVITVMGYELWGLEHISRTQGSLLRIYIDKSDGITLSDCERVSKQATGILDVNDPISGAYNLEVSSPGLDRLLFTLEQCSRYLGSQVRIKLSMKLDGKKNITGELREVTTETILIQREDDEFSVPVDMVEKARLVPQN